MKYRVNYGDGSVSPIVHETKVAARAELRAMVDPGASFVEPVPEPRDTIPCPPWFTPVEPETCRLEEL